MAEQRTDAPTPRTDGQLSGIDSFGNIPTMEDRYQRMCRHARILERETIALRARVAELEAVLRSIATLQTWNERAQAVPQARPSKADISNVLDRAIELSRTALQPTGGNEK